MKKADSVNKGSVSTAKKASNAKAGVAGRAKPTAADVAKKPAAKKTVPSTSTKSVARKVNTAPNKPAVATAKTAKTPAKSTTQPRSKSLTKPVSKVPTTNDNESIEKSSLSAKKEPLPAIQDDLKTRESSKSVFELSEIISTADDIKSSPEVRGDPEPLTKVDENEGNPSKGKLQ